MASRSEYRLKHPPLGVGGQAEVFEAMRRGTNEKVALKRVNARDVAAISRMKHEVEVQRSLNHPHIMPIFDFAPDYSWYTMPVACRILGKLSPPLPEQMVMEVVRHCALGLAHAHAHENIHRDVTPNNIVQLLDSGGTRWVVCDWGLVRRRGLTTVVRMIPHGTFGTEGFSAPELWDNPHDAGKAVDV